MPNYLFTIVDNALNISHYEIVQEYLIDIIKVILCKSSKLSMISIMGELCYIFKAQSIKHKIETISICLEKQGAQ